MPQLRGNEPILGLNTFREETEPFRKKHRHINAMLLPIMEKEVKKLLGTKIIIPLR
jgi:hypothetical protein